MKVISVNKSKKTATKAALSAKCCFSGGWSPDGENAWENGCDFVAVTEYEVMP